MTRLALAAAVFAISAVFALLVVTGLLVLLNPVLDALDAVVLA